MYNQKTAITIAFPGAFYTSAVGINDRNEVVGQYGLDDGPTIGFLYAGPILVSVRAFGSSDTGASSINNKGVVVGYFYDSNGRERGYIGTPDNRRGGEN